MVISASSTMAYKDMVVAPAQVAQDLGVRYVVLGSIQRANDDLRVSVELVDALAGNIIWAENYRRGAAGFFEIQDEISTQITTQLSAEYGLVAQSELARAKRKPPSDLNTYELVLIANETRDRYGKENNQKSLELLTRAAEIDPNFAGTFTGLAWTYYHEATNSWTLEKDFAKQKALDAAMNATVLDPNSAQAHYALGSIQWWLFNQRDEGVASFERALELEPNNADLLLIWGGWMLPGLDRAEEGLLLAKEALRINPRHANWYNAGMQYVLFGVKDYENSAVYFEKVKYPVSNQRSIYVATLAHLGRIADAKTHLAKVLMERPDLTIGEERGSGLIPSQDFKQRYLEGLGLAGLPD